MKEIKTNNGKKGGWLVGKRHYDKDGNSLGGIKAIVSDAGGKPVELEGGEVIINREASKKHWKELSRINQSAGNGVAIAPPSDIDEDPSEEYEKGGKIQFNANHLPSKWIISFAEKIRTKHPEIWKKGGNIFGNEAYENLKRVSKRGYWLDSEEWMYIKWRAFVARHKENYQLPGVVAMLKWVDKVDKGWKYMKDLIEAEIAKQSDNKMSKGGNIQKYAFVEAITTDGKKVYKIFDYVPSHKEVFNYFKNSKHKNNNGVTLIDSEIKIENLSYFNRTEFLKAADKIAMKNFGYRIADKNDLMFVFDKIKLNVFPFEAKLKNGKDVEISFIDGVILVKSNSSDDIRFEQGGEIKNYDYINYDLYTNDLSEKLYKSAQSYFDKKVTDDYWHFSTQYFNGEEITYEVYSNKGGFWLNFKIKNNKLLLSSAKLLPIEKMGKGGSIETYKEKYNKKYGYDSNESHSLEDISIDTGISIKGLQQIYNKGIGAYKTNPESVRPNVKSKEQWAMARVYSAVMGGDAAKVDANELKMEKGGSIDQKDTITMNIPLLIRTLELSREDIHSDAELHHVVERLLDLKNKPVLTMDDYEYIADIEHKHIKKMELGGNVEDNDFEKLLSQAHTNLTVKMGRPEYAPNKDELQEEIDKIIMEKQFGSNNI
jgi:Family of unknown function (DUF5824)